MGCCGTTRGGGRCWGPRKIQSLNSEAMEDSSLQHVSSIEFLAPSLNVHYMFDPFSLFVSGKYHQNIPFAFHVPRIVRSRIVCSPRCNGSWTPCASLQIFMFLGVHGPYVDPIPSPYEKTPRRWRAKCRKACWRAKGCKRGAYCVCVCVCVSHLDQASA